MHFHWRRLWSASRSMLGRACSGGSLRRSSSHVSWWMRLVDADAADLEEHHGLACLVLQLDAWNFENAF
eukprot:scaffold657_cov245-Pinguiococcus_pyrenoidosus.AAC.9